MKLLSVLLAAVLTPVVAFASTGVPGAYIQGGIGGTAIFTNGKYSFSKNETPTTVSGQIAAGYLWGADNVNFGVEAGVLNYSKAKLNIKNAGVDVASIKINGYNIDLLGVMRVNFDNNVNLFAKAGAARVHNKISGDVAALTNGSQSGSKVAPEAALGVGYQYDENWGINFTLDTVFAGKLGNNNKPVSRNGSALVGVSYRFV